MRAAPLAILMLLSGCLPRPDSPAGAIGQDSEAQLSARGNAIWRSLNGRLGMTVIAHRAVGSPAAVWHDRIVDVYVPVGANGKLADAIMSYELGRTAYVLGDGSFFSELTMPARYADAALHGPPSGIASWYAVAKGVQ